MVCFTVSKVHLSFTPNLLFVQLSAAKFGLPQSRRRVYIVMVRTDMASADKMDQLSQTVETVLPSALARRSGLEDVCKYVEKAMDGKAMSFPHTSKDLCATTTTSHHLSTVGKECRRVNHSGPQKIPPQLGSALQGLGEFRGSFGERLWEGFQGKGWFCSFFNCETIYKLAETVSKCTETISKSLETIAKVVYPFVQSHPHQPFAFSLQDGKQTSERRRQFVKACQKTLGLGPNGPMVHYSEQHLNGHQRALLNSRETESLDIQFASLVVARTNKYFVKFLVNSGQSRSLCELVIDNHL